MNKLIPAFLIIGLILTSCSSNENEVIDNNPENLLQSYTLKRDINGAYAIDFNTTKNTSVTTAKNTDRSNQITLSEAKHKTADKHTSNFLIENNELKIGFLETNKGKITQIVVEDDNIALAKGSVTEFLNSYSVTKNNDGSFTLNFNVNDNVTTDFIYNNELETYEIHLENGNAKQKHFSRTINVEENEILKIDFVNHKGNAKGEELSKPRKPRLIFDIIND